MAWAWAALSVVGVVLAFLAAFGIAVTVDALGLERLAGDLRLDLALWLGAWGGLSIAGVLGGGRLAYGHPLPIRRHALAAAGAGIALAVALELALSAWAVGRFGYNDADIIGPTAGLPFLLVPTAVALFGVLVAPRGDATAAMLALLASGGLALLVAFGNVGGALDGIGADSALLGALVALSAAYVLGALGLAARRLRTG
jgi:hypothetical protein